MARLIASDGKPLLREWSTAIYAELDGHIRAGGILVNSGWSGPEWSIDCTGFTGYLQGQPYDAMTSYNGVQVDPLDVVRFIWDYVQRHAMGNIGLQVSTLKTGLKVGEPLEDVSFDTENGPVNFQAGPIMINWWTTDDLGRKVDDLAEATPFEYHERHAWVGETDTIGHYLDFGYPSIGRRRTDLRFAVGENVSVQPQPSIDGDDFANGLLLLGSGEGRDMIRGYARHDDGRLRRVTVLDDKSVTSKTRAASLANTELAGRAGILDITSVTVTDHPNARFGSFGVGDEIRLTGNAGWFDVDMWGRITSITTSPESGECTLEILRTELVGYGVPKPVIPPVAEGTYGSGVYGRGIYGR
jgi:hypothetical protein